MKVRSLENRPELYADLQPIWEAFTDLYMVRPVGFAIGAIPQTEFESWLRCDGRTPEEDFGESCRLLRRMDDTYRDWIKKRDGNTDTGDQRTRNGGRGTGRQPSRRPGQ